MLKTGPLFAASFVSEVPVSIVPFSLHYGASCLQTIPRSHKLVRFGNGVDHFLIHLGCQDILLCDGASRKLS